MESSLFLGKGLVFYGEILREVGIEKQSKEFISLYKFSCLKKLDCDLRRGYDRIF